MSLKSDKSTNQPKAFPPILAKTWIDIITHTDDDALRNEIIDRLTQQFGSIMKASEFVNQHFGKK